MAELMNTRPMMIPVMIPARKTKEVEK